MTKTEILLTLLAEECVETAQRATKAIRFGLDEIQEGQELNNAQRIVYEFNDILAVIELLEDENLIPDAHDIHAVHLKRKKIDKWLKYSAEKGTLKEN